MPLTVGKSEHTTYKYQMSLTSVDIVTMLRERGLDVPYGADIFVMLPGGGDYSNGPLMIDMRTTVRLEWKVTKP